MSSFDFWTVKNISGRILVGLRWWNEVKDDGENQWFFESAAPGTFVADPVDSRVFWGSLYITPVLWSFLALVAILKFNFGWLLMNMVALLLTGSNAYGYIQCDKEARGRLERMATIGSMLV
eukprot:ANDGO_02766.mRNA.1 Golgi apparatus membrane protein TVP23